MKSPALLYAFTLFLLAAVHAPAAEDKPLELKSPDGNVALTFQLAADGAPSYAVAYKNRPVLLDSRLGLELKDTPSLLQGFKIAASQTASHDETWKPVAAERSPLRDHYNQLTVDLAGGQGRALRLTFRAYDEGAALRYTIPAQSGLTTFTIAREATEFRFTDNHTCCAVFNRAQGMYQPGLKLSAVKADCEPPLTVEIANGPAVAVGEAALIDYSRLRLRASDRPNAVQAQLGGPVTAAAPFSSPWRFVLIGDTPGRLLEQNYLVLNLNAPSLIPDTSWIKPGTAIREASLSTVGAKACIDFAGKMGLQYIEFDTGWYGPEASRTAKADGVHPDPGHPHAPLDLQAVIDYGKTKGVGVILYVNHVALERQADEIFPLYHKWGVKGVKFGFVSVGTQQWSKWNFDMIKKAADNQLMVDIHDEYRNTGISRTLPNLMTTEGVGGDEEFPSAGHFTSLPFTRALEGTFDNTVCMFDKRMTVADARHPAGPKTRAFQLAKAVIVFSPWQFLFWYDKPEAYHGEPYLNFWKNLPTVWDETRVVNGVIGQYVTEARRSGAAWYVATANAGERRTLRIPLSFLEPGKKYTAEIYSDGAPASSAPADLIKVKSEKKTVDFSTVLTADLSPIGGQAIRLVPEK